MPIYEYRCPECNNGKQEILSVNDRNTPQKCECGGVMTRLISLPLPAIFITTTRERLVNSLNDDEGGYRFPGVRKHGQRYKKVIGNSLFNQEKPVIGRGL